MLCHQYDTVQLFTQIFSMFFSYHFGHGGINVWSLSIDHFPPTWNLESLCNNFIRSLSIDHFLPTWNLESLCNNFIRSLSIDHFPPTWNLESLCNNFIWSFILIGLLTIDSAMFICLFYHSPQWEMMTGKTCMILQNREEAWNYFS